MTTITRRTAMTIAAAAVPATAMPALAAGPDPIFGAIERHKALWAAEMAIVGEQSRLEEEIPSERRVAYHIIHRGTFAGANDDPRWTAHQDGLWAASGATDAAAWALLDQPPVTPGGLAALLTYAVEFEDAGNHWSEDYETGVEWKDELHRVAAAALLAMSAA